MTPDQLGYALIFAAYLGPALVVARWVRRGW
jgi:hypothetical protein